MRGIRSLVALALMFESIHSSSIESTSPRSSTKIGHKIGELIQKLNGLTTADSGNDRSNIVEAREPSSSYGHGIGYGHGGGGYGHGSGGHGHGGGYGGGGGYGKGYGGGGHGAITLDPVSIISLLALGAFLINNILQLLQTNSMTTATGRSIDAIYSNLPSGLSSVGQGREVDNEAASPNFTQFFQNVGSLYYLNPSKRNMCIKKVVCSYVGAQNRETHPSAPKNLQAKIFDIMVSTITTLVAPEIGLGTTTEDKCYKFNKFCSDSILRDAKIMAETKIYTTLTSLISKFAISTFLPG